MIETIEFYKSLGFEIIMSVPENEVPVWVMLKNQEVTLMFQDRESLSSEIGFDPLQPTGGTFNLYIRVEDVKKYYQQMVSENRIASELHETFYGTREFTANDPNSYLLTFAQDLEAHKNH